jgi:hypothetical protein
MESCTLRARGHSGRRGRGASCHRVVSERRRIRPRCGAPCPGTPSRGGKPGLPGEPGLRSVRRTRRKPRSDPRRCAGAPPRCASAPISGSSRRSRPARESTARLIRRRVLALVSAGVNPIAMDDISTGRAPMLVAPDPPGSSPLSLHGPAASVTGGARVAARQLRRERSGPGKAMWKAAPPVSPRSAHTRPPCWSTRLWTMASPSPVPLGLVVKKGSNSRSRTSEGIPGPSSATTSSTPSSAPSSLQLHPATPGAHVERIEDRLSRTCRRTPSSPAAAGVPGGTSTTRFTSRASASPDSRSATCLEQRLQRHRLAHQLPRPGEEKKVLERLGRGGESRLAPGPGARAASTARSRAACEPAARAPTSWSAAAFRGFRISCDRPAVSRPTAASFSASWARRASSSRSDWSLTCRSA